MLSCKSWRRVGLVMALGAATVVHLVAVAGIGWACIPQPIVTVRPSNSAPAGGKVTLDGLRFAQGPVEVRWGALDGELLGKGTGPNFSADLTIPNTAPGVYSVLVFSRAADGSVGTAVQGTTFQVTGSRAISTTGAPTRKSAPPAGSTNSSVLRLLAGTTILLAAGAGLGVAARRRVRPGIAPTPEPSH